jgi:hypothetical protein
MSAPRDIGPHPSAMDFDRAELGSLPEDRRRELAAHVLACLRCAETQQAVQRSAARFRSEVFPRTLPRLAAATGGPAARLRRWWSTAGTGVRWASLAAPVAVGLVIASGTLVHQNRTPEAVDDEPAVSTKGGPALHVFVRRGTRVFAAHPRDTLAPGDAVRFVVEPAGHRYLLVTSIDGAGNVSVYHPFQGRQSAPLATDPRVELPGSIVLDRAPGPERIFALFSDVPLSSATVTAQLKQLAAAGTRIGGEVKLALPNIEQVSFLFQKAEPQR